SLRERARRDDALLADLPAGRGDRDPRSSRPAGAPRQDHPVRTEHAELARVMTDGVPDEVAPELTDELDLHTFRPRDCADVVEEYLHAAREAGMKTVRIIHGK